MSRKRSPGRSSERSSAPSSGSQLPAFCMKGRMTWSWRLIQMVPASTSTGSNWSHSSGLGTREVDDVVAAPSPSLRTRVAGRDASDCRRRAGSSAIGSARMARPCQRVRGVAAYRLGSLGHEGQLTANPSTPVTGRDDQPPPASLSRTPPRTPAEPAPAPPPGRPAGAVPERWRHLGMPHARDPARTPSNGR